MPELPEVETVARGVARRITGRVMQTVRLKRPDMLHGNGGQMSGLVGRRVEDVRRAGKQIKLTFRNEGGTPPPTMFVHLGMTGRLVAVDPDTPVERHTHLRITFSDGGSELRFCDPRRFGGIWLVAAEGDKGRRWKGRRLPPIAADPLTLTLPELRKLLDRRRQIKALLLDQEPISGIGNIYCDEMLHRCGIHPLTGAADLSPETVRCLHGAMRRVLNEAIRAGGSSISDYRDADNGRGSFQLQHRVYGRAGQPCRKCGHPIERLVVAGRGTYICPHCQPAPSTGA